MTKNLSALIYTNGINGSTGKYLIEPMSAPGLVQHVLGEQGDPEITKVLQQKASIQRRRFLGLPMGIDAKDVKKAGWGIVFGQADAEVRKALEPLIKHRQGRVLPDRCKVLDYKPGETMRDWLTRHKVAPGTMTPTKLPCYLLLVGDPQDIPFEFQYLLDVEYAVGRLCFDRPEQYGQYAESVVAYETSRVLTNRREVVYFGTRHAGDPATQMSAAELLTPLAMGVQAADGQPAEDPIAAELSYGSRCYLGGDAKKAALGEVLHDKGGAPAVLFTGSHGMGFDLGDERQRACQGALLCQDWTGFGSIAPDHYFAADDIADDARVSGMIAFHFACYGAGTPKYDNFLMNRNQERLPIADKPFVAALPQRLLSHPNGGALAVVGHVERAWAFSFDAGEAGSQIGPFRNFIGRVLAGEPVGHATKDFSERYAFLSAVLATKLDQPDPPPSDEELVSTWIERNDAQNYAILGDPAVQIRP